jgi:uncharacterized protein YjbI with pentapeptide repeats
MNIVTDDYRSISKDDVGGSYLGAECSGVVFADETLSHEYFNGAKLDRCLFNSKEIRHTWFKEARLTGCIFYQCSLKSSDLVFSVFEGCLFVDCDFSNGEWLESQFEECVFKNNLFHSTTLNLSKFSRCSFDAATFEGLNEQSVQYNVFELCEVSADAQLVSAFFHTNFGLRSDLLDVGSEQPPDAFAALSLKFVRDELSAGAFIALVGQVLSYFGEDVNRAHQLRSKYLRMICMSFMEQRQLSIVGMRILEKTIADYLSWLQPNQLHVFNELFSLVFSLRLECASRIEALELSIAEKLPTSTKIRSGNLFLEETYRPRQVKQYMDMMCKHTNAPTNAVNYTVEYGSTDIAFSLIPDLLLEATEIAGFIALTLKTLKVTLSDVKHILTDAKEIKTAVKKWTDRPPVDPPGDNVEGSGNHMPQVQSKTVIRILSGNDSNGLEAISSQLVDIYGHQLLEVDSPGELSIQIE